MLIGITASVYEISSSNHFWCNGITQNSIFFGSLLQKLEHKVYIIHNDPQKLRESNGYPSNLDVIHLDDIFEHKFDIIISLGHTMSENTYIKYRIKNPTFKHVLYVCGNTFLSITENLLFKDADKKVIGYPRYPYDQIWIVPQNEKTELAFSQYYYNVKNVTVVPFIWDPMIGEAFLNETKNEEYSYKEIKSFGIIEPNLSIVKSSLFPIMIAEEYLRKKHTFNDLYIMCAEKLKTNKQLIDFLSDTKLLKDKKVSVESRYPILTCLSKWFDLVISFQMENPLNYAYFDVTWWGWPIVHNAKLCQDIGYYYDEFNIDQATVSLEYAVKNHHLDLTYKERMRNILRRYTTENKKLLDDYSLLLDNLISDKFKKYTYDWKTNSIF